ncbi:hypothetical protein BD769DRAFT_1671256 [Suillus cothurnatus]|nr:hypothetical protein BD769DRAFT_1671256 [Suillus cothurnatus]
MSFNTQAYHDQIASQSSFVASTSFCDRVSWQHSTNGLIIVDREEQTPFVGVIAGRVSPFNLKCGTSGNYLKKGLLEKAKYQLHLICPTDKILGHDFDAAIHNLDEMQKVAGTTGDRRNMIIRDVTGEMLHMVANNTRIPDSPHSRRVPNAPLMDDTTEHWPMPTEYEDDFAHVKYTHWAIPLPVFEDDKPVSPLNINRTLDGALAEVHFCVHHWHLSGYDTFQAKIEKVNIIKCSASIPAKHHLVYHEVNDEEPPTKRTEIASVARSSKD